MKRFVAVWIALALLLCCACAGAEEQAVTARTDGSQGWRLSNDITVDPVLFRVLLDHLCPSRLLQLSAEKVAVLIDAVEPSLTVADGGLQLDVGISGENVLSIGGMLTDEGLFIGSTLFPSYTLSVSTGKLMQIVSDIAPMTAPPKMNARDTSAKAAPAAASPEAPEEAGAREPDSDDALPLEELSRYVSVEAPETVVFRVDGVSYDVKRTYDLNCDGIVGLWNTFVDWVFGNKGVASLLEIAGKAELKIDAEQIKAAIPTKSLPRFSATYYSSSAATDRLITAVASSNDGANVYGEARIQIAEDDVTARVSIASLPLEIAFELHREDGLQAQLDVRGKEPLLHASFNAADDGLNGVITLPSLNSDARLALTRPDSGAEGRLEINAAGNYLGSDFGFTPFDASGDGLRLVASLYYTDNAHPLFLEEFAIQPHAALTMDFTGAKKTVVPITSLINVTNGYLLGFALDIAFNGTGELLDATKSVLSKLNQAA